MSGATNAAEHRSLLPPHTAALLYGSEGDWTLPGTDTEECAGAAFHSPRPLFTQPTRLVLEGWFSRSSRGLWASAPDVYLCGTCRDNLMVLLQMLHDADGDLDWEVRREFGNGIRALALRGWKWFESHRPASRAPATG